MLTAALLGQTEEAPAPAAAPATETAAPSAKSVPVAASPSVPPEAQKLIARLTSKDDDERRAALDELQTRFSSVPVNPIVPAGDVDLERYLALPEAEQVRLQARRFVDELVSADVGRLVACSGLPFMLEDRRIDRADDLRAEWAKQLRGKRTDLLTIYDVAVFTPAEMEKKYGRPPPRLNGWPWRNAKTSIAVANLSGHAAVILLRQVGVTWQVIGYHD